MHASVFCMKYETSDFLANPLICLKQCRQNGNCPHIFPLSYKGKGGVGLVIEKHALSQLSHKCCEARQQHALTPVCCKKCHLYRWCPPTHALPPEHSGLCVHGADGRGRVCAGVCSEQKDLSLSVSVLQPSSSGSREGAWPRHCPVRGVG